MQIADANIVLRYVLNDHPELSMRAAEILEDHDVVVPAEVICEVVYVLQKVYHAAREHIKIKLSDMVSEGLITVEKPDALKHALSVYSAKNIDIVDAFYGHITQQRNVRYSHLMKNYRSACFQDILKIPYKKGTCLTVEYIAG